MTGDDAHLPIDQDRIHKPEFPNRCRNLGNLRFGMCSGISRARDQRFNPCLLYVLSITKHAVITFQSETK